MDTSIHCNWSGGPAFYLFVLLRSLIKNVADVRPRVEVGAYPLHLAAKRGRVPVLEAGLNDVTDDRGTRHPKALGFHG